MNDHALTNPFAPGQPWLAERITKTQPATHPVLFDATPSVDTPTVAPAELVIRALGEPVAQGSMNGYLRGKKVVLVPTNETELKSWRGHVADAAGTATRAFLAEHHEPWRRLDGAIEIGIVFFLEKPPSAPRQREWPEKYPDIDKCARAVLDALKIGGAIYDDARCVHLDAWQTYARPGVPLGARIVVRNAVSPKRPVITLDGRVPLDTGKAQR